MAIKTSEGNYRVWTRQNKAVLDEIKKNGIYRVKERYIRKKLDTCADIYLDVYKWLRNEAGKRMQIPDKAEYPIWLTTEEELKLPMSKGFVFFELEVPPKEIMVFDMLKWDYIANYLYLPKDDQDRKKFKDKLEKYNISVESDIYLQDFYPMLKKEMTSSWERLFDNDIKLSDKEVGICWEIKDEWIVDYEKQD